MDLERAIEFILDQQARTAEEFRKLAEQQVKADERHSSAIAEMNGILRRAMRLGVQEARAERKRRRELDEKMTQLAAAQVVTEEKLQNFITSLNRPTNGGPPKQ